MENEIEDILKKVEKYLATIKNCLLFFTALTVILILMELIAILLKI